MSRDTRAVARSADPVGGALIGLTSLQFGAVVVLGKKASASGLSVASLLAYRFAIAAALLAVSLAALRQPLLAARGEGWRLGLLGMAGYALEAGLFFAALRHGTASAVTLLFFTYPVWVSAISVLSGKGRPRGVLVAAMVAAVAGAGIVVLASGETGIDPAGVTLALGSAIAFSIYLAGADAAVERTNSLTGAMWVSASAGTGLALYAIVSSSGQWPAGLGQWAPLVGMAVLTAGAFVCLFAGLRRLGAVRTSIVAASEPLAATVLAALFLGERIRPGTAAGGALILGAAIAASVSRQPAAAEGPPP